MPYSCGQIKICIVALVLSRQHILLSYSIEVDLFVHGRGDPRGRSGLVYGSGARRNLYGRSGLWGAELRRGNNTIR